MAALEVRLFGKVFVEQDGRPVSSLSAKALELLCYLLVYRDRAHTREALAGVLWPEASYPLSKKYLRQTLWQLQTTLGSQPGDGDGTRHDDGRGNGGAAAGNGNGNGNGQVAAEGLLLLNPGWVRLNPGAGWWLDVEAFEDAYTRCRDLPGHDLTDAHAQALEEAVVLYQGDLIEAWYHDWCIYERDRLQLTYLAMLEKLMSWCEARGAYARGVAYGQRILRHDPARECTHRQLMRLYHQAGDRTTALRQYERCAAAVAKEFNLEPSEETIWLYRQIRAGHLEGGLGPVTPPPPVGVADARLLADLQVRLDHIQATMSAFKDQIHQLTLLSVVLRDSLQTPRQTVHETP
ncbi:MAG TPA: BTAD domain-containing putative transcriptional regulator [Actinomycetes bacterium]|nr:BTAD domain-containing putative transcriptional regulator [Actinomycetes bacterium]